MRLFHCLSLLLMLFGIGGGVLAQDETGAYRFRPQGGDSPAPAWPNRGGSPVPWRAPEGDFGINGSAGGTLLQPIPQGNRYRPPVVDYAQPPPGLPRGLYRPVEERHTITPHLGGYRFRPLRPDEQSRLGARNPRAGGSVNASGWQKSTRDGRETKPVFRPDKRFERDSRARYTLPSGPSMPRFRPQ